MHIETVRKYIAQTRSYERSEPKPPSPTSVTELSRMVVVEAQSQTARASVLAVRDR